MEKRVLSKKILGTTTTTTLQELDNKTEDIKENNPVEFEENNYCGGIQVCRQSEAKELQQENSLYTAGRKVSTCPSCQTAQKVKTSSTGVSARLCGEIEGKDI